MARKHTRRQTWRAPNSVVVSSGSPKPQRLWQIPLVMAGLGAIVFSIMYLLHPGTGSIATAPGISVPVLSAGGRAGQRVFQQNCAQCHGLNADGSKQGPPLVHRIYEPLQHTDSRFRAAVDRGVQAHHWNFGNMPRIGLSDLETQRVIEYVRELQRANGIG